MATSSPTFDTLVTRASWRERIKITRMTIFSLLFLIMGVWLVIGGAGGIGSGVTTKLTFGAGVSDIFVPTLGYALVVGVLYALGGIVGLIPGENRTLYRVQWVWLFVNGVLVIPTVLIIAAAGNSTNVTVMLQVSLTLATPIVLGALAGIWCERSGVVNIAIEGMMLAGACFGFVAFTLLSPSLGTSTAQLLGVLAAVAAGGAMALLHAWLSITFKTDQIISGTVINILAVGLTSFVRREVLLSSQAGRDTLQQFNIPILSNIPVLGDVFFKGQPIFYMMFVLLVVTHVVLFYTRWGLRTRAVGENPHAADSVGINVRRNRWINVFIGGLIAGLAGAWFSLERTGAFDDNMTSGRGFIALAAMIFGKYTPIGALAGGLLFGFSDALGQRFQFLGVPVPPQFLQMVPYLITIVVLAGLVGKAVGPKADGIPFDKEGT
ncbi:MAG: ABC transporter permease [Chloroflexota bacterium]